MKSWYLDTPSPNLTSGFENDALSEYATSTFGDVLQISFADTAILCSPDLSDTYKIRCVIQGNTADTQLKSIERTILVPIGTLHAGNYVYYDREYWIVDGYPGNNKSYEKATLKLCQYKLRWQKDDGSIVERWCNLTSASKYDVGEGGNNTIILTSNNYTILIPYDDDGHTIEGKRVFIDTSSNPHKVFKITRNDDPLFLFGSHGGVLSLIADKTELDAERDRPDLKLCDYVDLSSPTLPTQKQDDKATNLFATILYVKDKNLKVGFPRTYAVSLTDDLGNPVDWHGHMITWYMPAYVEYAKSENQVQLIVKDESYIGSSFTLQCQVDDDVSVSIDVAIMEGF